MHGGLNLEVDLKVVEHKKTETADKAPRFVVTFKGITIDAEEVKFAIKSDKETLFKEFPLKSDHTIKLTSPQTKLS